MITRLLTWLREPPLYPLSYRELLPRRLASWVLSTPVETMSGLGPIGDESVIT